MTKASELVKRTGVDPGSRSAETCITKGAVVARSDTSVASVNWAKPSRNADAGAAAGPASADARGTLVPASADAREAPVPAAGTPPNANGAPADSCQVAAAVLRAGAAAPVTAGVGVCADDAVRPWLLP